MSDLGHVPVMVYNTILYSDLSTNKPHSLIAVSWCSAKTTPTAVAGECFS